jgi:hypothetical protein
MPCPATSLAEPLGQTAKWRDEPGWAGVLSVEEIELDEREVSANQTPPQPLITMTDAEMTEAVPVWGEESLQGRRR